MRSSEVIIEKLAAMSKEAAYGMETAKKGYKAVKGGVSRAYKGYVSALKGKGIKATGQNLKNVDMAADYGVLAGDHVERFGKAYKAHAKEKLKTLAARGATGVVGGAGVVGAGALAINRKGAPVEKSAFIIPGAVGAARASGLSADEAQELRGHYGLKPKRGLKTRSFWRSAAMGTLGGAAGGMVGAPFGATATGLGGLAGTIGGTIYGSNKYTKGNLRKIRAEKASQQ